MTARKPLHEHQDMKHAGKVPWRVQAAQKMWSRVEYRARVMHARAAAKGCVFAPCVRACGRGTYIKRGDAPKRCYRCKTLTGRPTGRPKRSTS